MEYLLVLITYLHFLVDTIIFYGFKLIVKPHIIITRETTYHSYQYFMNLITF
jgi:hypothetical protein